MSFIIDAHQDLAYNALTFGRDLLRSAAETRQAEQGGPTPQRNGHALLGWPDYQRGQVAVIFATLFLSPRRYGSGPWETQVYSNADEARHGLARQMDYYRMLAGDHPDQFRLVLTRQDLQEVLTPWEKAPAHQPEPPRASEDAPAVDGASRGEASVSLVTHPVGLVLLMEGLEGISAPEEMEAWWEQGVRIAGPVWAGTRFCGGMYEPGGFTREGMALLEVLGELGFTLDISHMNEESALTALDRYDGPVIASHSNVRALLKDGQSERHLSDRVIRRLVERDGLVGVVPYNRFLRPGWNQYDDRQAVSLKLLAAHIDHICQIAGDARHVGLGTDFDGGFGWPYVPHEIDTIADLQKLAPVLQESGYEPERIADILGGNWRQHLERTLPEI